MTGKMKKKKRTAKRDSGDGKENIFCWPEKQKTDCVDMTYRHLNTLRGTPQPTFAHSTKVWEKTHNGSEAKRRNKQFLADCTGAHWSTRHLH